MHTTARLTRAALVAALPLVLVAAPASAAVAPDVGGPSTAFVITFTPRGVSANLEIIGPRHTHCRNLWPIHVPIRRMQSGRVRFGPTVPGARPRVWRTHRRLRRWCRGRYETAIYISEEFEPSVVEVLGEDVFTVR